MNRVFLVCALASSVACSEATAPSSDDSAPPVSGSTTGMAQSWVGTGSSTNSGYVANAQLTWAFETAVAGIASYRPTGTVTVTVPGCSIAPNSASVTPTTGVLQVDYNTNPPTYHGVGVTAWTATYTCPQVPSFTGGVSAGFLGGIGGVAGANSLEAAGQVGGNGQTIAGTATNSDTTFTWSLTRQGTR